MALCSRELVLDSASYQWGLDDVAKLPRPFHQAAGLRQDGDIPPFNALDMIHKHIADDAHKVPFAGLPVIPDSLPSAPVETAPPIWTITINSEDYKLLHAEAKRNICTASAWVGAVLTLLMYELNDVEGMRTIRFPLQPVDARRYMLLEDAQRYHGVAIGGGNVDMTDLGTIQAASSDLKKSGEIPPSFWAVAKEYKEGLLKLMVRLPRHSHCRSALLLHSADPPGRQRLCAGRERGRCDDLSVCSSRPEDRRHVQCLLHQPGEGTELLPATLWQRSRGATGGHSGPRYLPTVPQYSAVDV